MLACTVVVLALLALCCLLSRFSRMQESTMNAILAKQWFWIYRHTWVQTDSGKVLINERIDAAYATHSCEALEYAHGRHPLKPNMILTAYPCRNAADRYDARLANGMVTKRILDFEEEMQAAEQRMR